MNDLGCNIRSLMSSNTFLVIIGKCEVSGRGLLRDKQFAFRPKHSTSPKLARLVERVTRNFGEKRLRSAMISRRGYGLR
jgi:hypothetical protein